MAKKQMPLMAAAKSMSCATNAFGTTMSTARTALPAKRRCAMSAVSASVASSRTIRIVLNVSIASALAMKCSNALLAATIALIAAKRTDGSAMSAATVQKERVRKSAATAASAKDVAWQTAKTQAAHTATALSRATTPIIFVLLVTNVQMIWNASTAVFAKIAKAIITASTGSVLKATNGKSISAQTAATASNPMSFASTAACAKVVLRAITANTAIVLTMVPLKTTATTSSASSAATASKAETAATIANSASIVAKLTQNLLIVHTSFA